MPEIELLMPEMGESVTDATVGNWLVAEGDTIQEDQDVLEVSTDKVDTEIPSPVNGIIKTILHREGEVVAVGKPLAIIEVAKGANVEASPAVQQEMMPQTVPTEAEPAITEAELKHPKPPYIPEISKHETEKQYNSNDRFFSPLVKNIAKQEGISEEELQQIPGTGVDGRVTKDDMMQYLNQRSDSPELQKKTEKSKQQYSPIQQLSMAQNTPLADRSKVPSATIKEGDELVEMDKMRKLIANHMVVSKQLSPHATLFLEADVTNLWNWRNKVKQAFLQREGQKLTFTPLFIEAATKAIKAFPGVNVSVVDHNKILYKKQINIGMATAMPNGNLIVPVVKNTSDKTLSALAKEVNDLANRARNHQLKPDDTTEGTFTITNIGTFDSLMGTPIINQPQAAILAIGAIKKKPVVLESPEGDVIAIRHMMYLSLSMDHRVVDGALGGAFLQKVKQELEHWDIDREV